MATFFSCVGFVPLVNKVVDACFFLINKICLSWFRSGKRGEKNKKAERKRRPGTKLEQSSVQKFNLQD